RRLFHDLNILQRRPARRSELHAVDMTVEELRPNAAFQRTESSANSGFSNLKILGRERKTAQACRRQQQSQIIPTASRAGQAAFLHFWSAILARPPRASRVGMFHQTSTRLNRGTQKCLQLSSLAPLTPSAGIARSPSAGWSDSSFIFVTPLQVTFGAIRRSSRRRSSSA